MTKPGFVEKRMTLWRDVMEKEFIENVGDDGLFPNHTDKDIWMTGFEVGYKYYMKSQEPKLQTKISIDENIVVAIILIDFVLSISYLIFS
jgi:hypothetical protein